MATPMLAQSDVSTITTKLYSFGGHHDIDKTLLAIQLIADWG